MTHSVEEEDGPVHILGSINCHVWQPNWESYAVLCSYKPKKAQALSAPERKSQTVLPASEDHPSCMAESSERHAASTAPKRAQRVRAPTRSVPQVRLSRICSVGIGRFSLRNPTQTATFLSLTLTDTKAMIFHILCFAENLI